MDFSTLLSGNKRGEPPQPRYEIDQLILLILFLIIIFLFSKIDPAPVQNFQKLCFIKSQKWTVMAMAPIFMKVVHRKYCCYSCKTSIFRFLLQSKYAYAFLGWVALGSVGVPKI